MIRVILIVIVVGFGFLLFLAISALHQSRFAFWNSHRWIYQNRKRQKDLRPPPSRHDPEHGAGIKFEEINNPRGECPICQCQVQQQGAQCGCCGIWYHRDCANYAGLDCAIYGCQGEVEV